MFDGSTGRKRGAHCEKSDSVSASGCLKFGRVSPISSWYGQCGSGLNVIGGLGNGAIDGGGLSGIEEEDEAGRPGGIGGKVIRGGVCDDKATTVLNGLQTVSDGCTDTDGGVLFGCFVLGLTPKRY